MLSSSELFPADDHSPAARTHRKALELFAAGGVTLAAALSAAIKWHNVREAKRQLLEQSLQSDLEKVSQLSSKDAKKFGGSILQVTAAALSRNEFTPDELSYMLTPARGNAGYVFGVGMSFLLKDKPSIDLLEKSTDPMANLYRVSDEFILAIYNGWPKLTELRAHIEQFDPEFTIGALLERVPDETRELGLRMLNGNS